jgi:5-methylcytosine-specific restriction endonuclease McrA
VDRSLLLNASYEPLKVITWQKAVILLIKEKVEVIASHDRTIRAVYFTLELPSVLRLLRRVRVEPQFHRVPFSRSNIYLRDRYRCQYCARRFQASKLTFDHVVPVSHGGRKDWENIVTCCIDCNRKKGGKAPKQAWRDYLFWSR